MSALARHRLGHGSPGAFQHIRSAIISLSISAVAASPIGARGSHKHSGPDVAEGGALYVLYAVSILLVLLGGAFAGLTIALMGQDSVYLQVIAQDPEEPQHHNAKRVSDLLNRGKHWVLVTLLLSNVIVNETLPVVLDRCFGGGVAAVVGSTVLIVIFGEILPQSVCVRYGLQIGGAMSKPVLVSMWLMAPIAWPTAKLLDWLLGEDHGTVYKKSGLKTLVTLHKSLGDVSERLNQDEVTIISAVLDLKRKPVGEVMTPMDDVYTMSEETVLDEKTIDQILDAGYSRIPIHQTGKPSNFIGMLLVKILITYDPEDCKRVRDFALATLPETRPETSCLDIINFFQEGKSHMVLISEYPGEDHGALGVVTLEDVIEELIGEEIIDESDVYVDVHKAIRRSHPAPKARYQRLSAAGLTAAKDANLIDIDDNADGLRRVSSVEAQPTLSSSPRTTTLMMRRSSTGQDGQVVRGTIPVKTNVDDMRDHLKHLGPSNRASDPKGTRLSAIKIKPGVATLGPNKPSSNPAEGAFDDANLPADERTSLLRPGIAPKDGIQALHRTYTARSSSDGGFQSPDRFLSPDMKPMKPIQTIDEHVTSKEPIETQDFQIPDSHFSGQGDGAATIQQGSEENTSPTTASSFIVKRSYVRSGSITENIVEAGGIRKVVLEANSSSEDGEEGPRTPSSQLHSRSRTSLLASIPVSEEEEVRGVTGDNDGASDINNEEGEGVKKKKKNRRKNRSDHS